MLHDSTLSGLTLETPWGSWPLRLDTPTSAKAVAPHQRTGFRGFFSLGNLLPPPWEIPQIHAAIRARDYNGNLAVVRPVILKTAHVEPHCNVFAPMIRIYPSVRPERDRKHVLAFQHRRGIGGAQTWLNRVVDKLKYRNEIEISCRDLPPVNPNLPELHGLWHHENDASYSAQIEAALALIRETDPDMVLCNTVECLAAAEAARRNNIPFVWAIHESYSPGSLWASIFGLRPASRSLTESLDACLAAARSLIFVSSETATLYRGTCQDAQIYVVPFAPEPTTIPPHYKDRAIKSQSLNAQPFRTLVLGTIEERKNLAPLIGALTHVRLQRDVKLTIAGPAEQNYYKHLKRVIAQHGQEQAVELIPREVDALTMLSETDLLISTSDVESRSTVVLEAWRSGIAVLAANACGMSEIINDKVNGLLVPVGDYYALAEAWAYLAKNQSQRERMAAAGRAQYLRQTRTDWTSTVLEIISNCEGEREPSNRA